jgi:ATP/maltotriose-dependent transcriptional regulator MalT
LDEAVAAFRAGDTDRAELLAAVALSSARTDADAARVVDALCMQARVALRRGDISTVSSLGEEAGETARRTGQRELETMPLHMRAVAARMRRDYPTARRLYEESIRLNESLGDEVMVTAEFRNLAYVELHTGNSDRARELFAGAAVHADESGY